MEEKIEEKDFVQSWRSLKGKELEMESEDQNNFSYYLMNVDEVSKILNISKSKVYRMIKAGELPSVLVGYSKRVHPDDLKKYINSFRNSLA